MEDNTKMKCPCCDLTIGDYLPHHLRNCHPEHLQKQWEAEGLTPQEMAMKFLEGFDTHALEFTLGAALKLFASVTIVPGQQFKIVAVTKENKTIESDGSTLYSALQLAIDRLRFGDQK